MKLERKTIAGTRLKANDAGSGTAEIATLNVIDSDGDVTLPGAFGTQHVKMIPAHDWQHVPIGKAKIREDGDKVLADFHLNLEIEAARDWHASLKHDLATDPPLQEWSYGFGIVEASFGDFDGQEVRFLKKLKVSEISPVLLGAGVGTHTIAIKEASGQSLKLADHIAEASKAVDDVLERLRKAQAVRMADGRDLSPDRYAELGDMEKALQEVVATTKAITDLLKRGPEKEEISEDEAAFILAEYVRVSSNLSRAL